MKVLPKHWSMLARFSCQKRRWCLKQKKSRILYFIGLMFFIIGFIFILANIASINFAKELCLVAFLTAMLFCSAGLILEIIPTAKAFISTFYGKLLTSGIFALVTNFSLIISKHIVHYYVGEDPNYFPLSIATLTILFIPFIFLLLLFLLFSLVAFLNIALVYPYLLLRQLGVFNRAYKILNYRIFRFIMGTKTLHYKETSLMMLFSRYMGVFGAMVVLAMVISPVASLLDYINARFAHVLVTIEYYDPPKDMNLDKNVKVAYLGEERISIATRSNGNISYQFKTVTKR